MKLVIISLIVAIVMIVADHGKTEEFQKRYPAEKLDEILENFDIDYRKEITESVFKPCLQYVAEKDYSLYKRIYPNITKNELEKLVDSSVALEAIQLRKTEPLIYDVVKDKDAKMRELHYALFAEQCKRKKTNQ